MTIQREGRLSILPPKIGSCALCGELHDKREPHNNSSILYQHKFRMKYGRYPTWEDAMGHCSLYVKKRFAEELAKAGIEVNTERLMKEAEKTAKGTQKTVGK